MNPVYRRPSRSLLDRITVPFLWIGYGCILYTIARLAGWV